VLPQLQQLRHLRVVDSPSLTDPFSLSPGETERLLLAPQLAALELVNISIQLCQQPDDASGAESEDDYWAWQSSEYDTDTEDTSDDESPADFLAQTHAHRCSTLLSALADAPLSLGAMGAVTPLCLMCGTCTAFPRSGQTCVC
jgi:hypothetical protein